MCPERVPGWAQRNINAATKASTLIIGFFVVHCSILTTHGIPAYSILIDHYTRTGTDKRCWSNRLNLYARTRWKVCVCATRGGSREIIRATCIKGRTRAWIGCWIAVGRGVSGGRRRRNTGAICTSAIARAWIRWWAAGRRGATYSKRALQCLKLLVMAVYVKWWYKFSRSSPDLNQQVQHLPGERVLTWANSFCRLIRYR